MSNTNQFYSYAIFLSWTIVFFAILAVFYNYMEVGILLPTPMPNRPTEHVFEWMKEKEPEIEPITDMTYKDNKELDEKIYNLKNDPVYQIALNDLHVEQLKREYGKPYPDMYYMEPFQDSVNLSEPFSPFRLN